MKKPEICSFKDLKLKKKFKPCHKRDELKLNKSGNE